MCSQAREIRKILFNIGMTQRDAAKKIGVSDRTMRKYCCLTRPHNTPKRSIIALKTLKKNKK